MLGRDWCRRGGKRSRYDTNSLSSRTCNTIFVECLVQDAYGNVAVRQGRLLASPQDMYINRIRRRREKRFEHSLGLRNIIWGLRIDQGGRTELRLKKLQNVRSELGITYIEYLPNSELTVEMELRTSHIVRLYTYVRGHNDRIAANT